MTDSRSRIGSRGGLHGRHRPTSGLGCVLGSLTTALGNVGSLPSDPTERAQPPRPSLTGVVTDVTGTLANLSSLLPIASLPLPARRLPPRPAGHPGSPGAARHRCAGALGGGLPRSGWLHQPGWRRVPAGSPSLLDGVTGRRGRRLRLDVSVAAGRNRRHRRERKLSGLSIAGITVPGVPGLTSTASGGTTATPPTVSTTTSA